MSCGITAKTSNEQRANINNACEELAQTLRKAVVRAQADLRDGYTPGYEFNDWEQKGVPLHLEIRLDYLAKKRALTVRRDTGVKNPAPLDNIGSTISSILETIQTDTLTTVK
ncbi:anticodon-binding protein [Coprinopsis sp. MPI-PUGE-AT-0042]|nr:anticodon-binding protein [Coprinopsis sp. MPI-PUGE-AT-0042]